MKMKMKSMKMMMKMRKIKMKMKMMKMIKIVVENLPKLQQKDSKFLDFFFIPKNSKISDNLNLV